MYQFRGLKSISRSSAVYFIAAIIFFFTSKQLNAIDKIQPEIFVLPVTVTNKSGEPVKGIPHDHFTVFIDKSPHEVNLLRQDEDLPVSLTIALDVSGSMRAKVSKVRETLKAFLLQDTLKGEVSLLTFNDESQFMQDWTENRKEVINNLALLDTSKFKQTSRLLDACNKSLIHFKNAKNQKKVILIITDSGDLNSVTKADELRRLCQEQNVVIHTIALFDSADDRNITTARYESYASNKQIEELSFFSGGTYFPIVSARELESVFSKITSYTRYQYFIGIEPSIVNNDGKRYRLEVKVLSPPGSNKLTVRSRDYYYAIPNKK